MRKAPLDKSLAVLVELLVVNSAYACAVILELNLKFVDSGVNDELEGEFGIHLVYEMTEWKDWHFCGQQEDMYWNREFLHDTKSVYATTRPCNEPIIFKAGIVETSYKVLLEDDTQNIMQTTDVGYGSGYGLAPG